MKDSKYHFSMKWLSVMLMLVLIVTTVLLWRTITVREDAAIHRVIQQEVSRIAANIENSVNTKVTSLTRMAKRWETRGGYSKKAWLNDAHWYIKHDPDIQAIEWVDTQYVIRWVAPLRGNEQALNLNLSFEKYRREALLKSRRGKKILMTHTVDLVQGGKGFLIYIPVFVKQKFNGFILEVFRVDRLINGLLTKDSLKNYQIMLSQDNHLIYGKTVGEDAPGYHWKQSKKIQFYGQSINLQISPTKAMLISFKTWLPLIALLSGLFISLLVFISFWLLGSILTKNRELKISSETIRLREQQNSLLLESAAEGIYGVDVHEEITFINPAAAHMLGYSVKELIGKSTHLFIRDIESPLLHHATLLRQKNHAKIDELLWRKDGSSFPVEHTSTPISNETKDIIGSVITFNDTTYRRDAEAALKTRSNEMQLIYESTRNITESKNYETALKRCINLVCGFTGWPVGHAYILPEEDSTLLEPSDIWYIEDEEEVKDFKEVTEKTTFAFGIGLPGRVWSSGKPIWVEDVGKDTNFPRNKKSHNIKVHAAVAFPIFIGHRLTAVLEFFSFEALPEDQALLHTLTILGEQVSRVWERWMAEKTLQESELKNRTLINSAVDSIIVINQDGDIQQCNQATSILFGYQENELINKNITMLMQEKAAEEHRTQLNKYLKTGESHIIGKGIEIIAVKSSGKHFPVHLTVSEMRLTNSVQFVGILRDISQQKLVEKELRDSEERIRLLLTSAGEGIYGLDLEGKSTFINTAALRMLGYSEKEVLDQPMHALIHYKYPNDSPYPQENCPMYAAFHDGEVHHVSDEVLWRKDGSSFPVEYTSTPIRHNEELAGAVVIFSDISEHINAQKKLERLAHYDYLTELYNRAYFEKKLNELISQEKRSEGFFALLYLDLDNFKEANDQLGHTAGDQLLKQVAKRLQDSLRVYDTLARMGGDEFAILLPDITDQSYINVVCGKIIELLTKPFEIYNTKVTLGVSIGIACYPRDGKDNAELLRHADIALYSAKDAGRHCYKYYSD